MRRSRFDISLTYILLFIAAAFAIIPLLWAIAASFTPNALVFKNAIPFSIKAFIPVDFTLESYDLLFESGFGKSIGNTLILAFVNIFVGGLFAALAGFAFGTFEFRGKNVLFALILVTFMVPADMVAIPRYILVAQFDWLNTWQGLIVPMLANSLVIFLFRQFFAEIPHAIYDAARVDGASWLRIFFGIAIPISKPVLISAGLVLFLGQWEQLFWPLLVAPTDDLQVVQLAVKALAVGEHSTTWSVLFAGSMVAAIIPVMLILPFQHYYIQGITGSGIKE